MADNHDAELLALQVDRRRRKRQLRTRLRYLRDSSNPFDIDEVTFTDLYRLPQHLVLSLAEILRPRLEGVRASKIPVHFQVLITLRFFAHGSYQRGLAQEHLQPCSQPSVSRIINKVASLLAALARNYIRFPQTREERIAVSNRFLRLNRINGILGLIDCFVVKFIRPAIHEEAYHHYRHGASLNVQVICDDRYLIQNLRICPGRANDQHIWNHSDVKNYMERLRVDPRINEEEVHYYLLGDSGYTLSPILLTPQLDAVENTPTWHYTENQLQTRCRVEMTFGVFTNTMQGISRRRTLHYTPVKTATFITAAAVLHNYRLLNGVAFPIREPEVLMENNVVPYDGSYRAGTEELNEIITIFYE